MNSDPTNREFPLILQLEHQPSFIKAGLTYSSLYSNVRSQSFPLRFTVSEILKFNGNSLYKSGEYLQASGEYEKSLSIFRYIVKKPRIYKKGGDEEIEHVEDMGSSANEKTKITAHKLGLYLNLSLCYLIMGRCFNALRASQEALKLDPYNPKALYRSAKAKIMNKDSSYHELVSAKNELELALKQQSNDQLIKQDLAKLLDDLSKTEEKTSLINNNPPSKNDLPKFNGRFNNDEKSDRFAEQFEKPAPSLGDTFEHDRFERNDRFTDKFDKNDRFLDNAGRNDRFERFDRSEKQKDRHGNFERNFDKFDNALDNINFDKTALDKRKPAFDPRLDPSERTPEAFERKFEPKFDPPQNKKEFIPKEIQDLEQFLKTKGQDIVKLYETVGKYKEADDFRKEMKAALEAKTQIEKIGLIDFDKQNSYLREMAEKYKIDINNPLLKSELLRIQNHNVKELRQWMDNLRQIDTDSILNKNKAKNSEKIAEIPLKSGDPLSSDQNVNSQANGNNYFINNNFYSPLNNSNNQFINNYGQMSEENLMKWIENQKGKGDSNEKIEEEEGEISGVISCLNCSLWFFSILFVFLTMIFQFF